MAKGVKVGSPRVGRSGTSKLTVSRPANPKISGLRTGIKSPQLTPKKSYHKPSLQQLKARKNFGKTSKRGFKFQHKIRPRLEQRFGKLNPEVNTTDSKGKRKRIDWVTRSRRPISVKNTQWNKVQLSTLKRYINEAASYPGRKIRSDNVPKKSDGQHIRGRHNPLLVVPKLSYNKPNQKRLTQFKELAAKKDVSVRFY